LLQNNFTNKELYFAGKCLRHPDNSLGCSKRTGFQPRFLIDNNLLVKIYPLAIQAESAAEQMDWIEKITGVITSLLTSQTPERVN